MVLVAVSRVATLSVGSTFTTSASNPASSIVSTTMGVNFCDSTTTRAEWPMRSTTTSETPFTSDNKRVMVLEQAAHVIPPTESNRVAGPCSSTGAFGTSCVSLRIGNSTMTWLCFWPGWRGEHWATYFFCLVVKGFDTLWEKFSGSVAPKESCAVGGSTSNPASSMASSIVLLPNFGLCRTLTVGRTIDTSVE